MKKKKIIKFGFFIFSILILTLAVSAICYDLQYFLEVIQSADHDLELKESIKSYFYDRIVLSSISIAFLVLLIIVVLGFIVSNIINEFKLQKKKQINEKLDEIE